MIGDVSNSDDRYLFRGVTTETYRAGNALTPKL
jgi:hypothetical protein